MKIAFIQVVCPTYKVSLFKKLHSIYNVDFFIGDKNNASVAPNADNIDFPFSKLKNNFIKFVGIDWLFQSSFSKKDIKRYDLIILPLSVPNLLNYKVLFWAKIYGIKVGFYGMGLNYQKKHSNATGFLEKIRRFLFNLSDFTVVYTEEIKEIVLTNSTVESRKIFVAPNTLDIEKIDKQIVDSDNVRKRFSADENTLLLTYVGRLSPQKNPAMLLDVLSILKGKGHKAKLVYVGTGEEKILLKKRAENSNDVIFLGATSEKISTEILKASDFSVMPGMTGLAVVHSFICKTVYITVDDNLHSPEFDYLTNNETGFVVKPTAKNIAEKIIYLVNFPKEKQKIEENAFQYAIKELSIDKQVEGFKRAFDFIKEKS
jgi:glycosyltransferase involved in cell wall biosynthesis